MTARQTLTFVGAMPQELSGGELARAGLAVALAHDPDTVPGDEPTGELDAEREQQILTLLEEPVSAGAGLLEVTHSAEVVAIAGHVIASQTGPWSHEFDPEPGRVHCMNVDRLVSAIARR